MSQSNYSGLKEKVRVYAILLLFSFFLLFFCGSDGWFRMPYEHGDSSWFLMGGKAWTAGLTPYLDFTDSKGPLLWLIYGLGHYISPYNFYGVFWIETLAYWIAFILIYKSALMLLNSHVKALTVSFLMAIFFFLPGVHMEVRAEDYNQCLNAGILYILLRVFVARMEKKIYFFSLGIMLGMSLLIKFNFTLIQFIPTVMILLFIRKEMGLLKAFESIVLTVGGFIVMVSPFIIYLGVEGALANFIKEYFFNTLTTVYIVRDLAPLPWSQKWFVMLFIVITLLALSMPKRLFKSKWLRLTVILWYAGSLVMVLSGAQEYYFNILGIFAFPGLCTILWPDWKLNICGSIMIGAMSIFSIVIVSTLFEKGEFYDVEQAIKLNATYERINLLVEKYTDSTGRIPTVSYVDLQDRGEHITTGMLPGSFYYAHQNGSTEEMHRRNLEDVFDSRPDFVIVKSSMTLYRSRLEKAGYQHVMSYNRGPSTECSLYEKVI